MSLQNRNDWHKNNWQLIMKYEYILYLKNKQNVFFCFSGSKDMDGPHFLGPLKHACDDVIVYISQQTFSKL